ncbi:hypothetical protein ACWEQ0_07120 [Nocardia thailandica]
MAGTGGTELLGEAVVPSVADPENLAPELFRALGRAEVRTRIPLRTRDADELAEQLARRRPHPEWRPWVGRLRRDARRETAGTVNAPSAR